VTGTLGRLSGKAWMRFCNRNFYKAFTVRKHMKVLIEEVRYTLLLD
jgi:hypothetical protein